MTPTSIIGIKKISASTGETGVSTSVIKYQYQACD